jgi:ribose transport system permease protein
MIARLKARASDLARPGGRETVPGEVAGADRTLTVKGIVLRVGPYSTLIVWALSLIVFSAMKPEVFATTSNFRAVLSEQAILVVVAIGLIVPLIAGQFDLSIGATMSVCGLITAGLMSKWDLPWGLAFCTGLAIGVTVGLVNGLLVAYGGIHSFIASLGTATLISGFILWYGRGQIIFENISDDFVAMAQTKVAGVQLTVVYAIAVALLVWFLLRYTPFGRYLYAIGGNRAAAEVAGVRVRRLVLYSMMVSGLFAAFAGILLASRTSSAQTGAGDTFLLPAFAVAFIGAATFRRGEFNVLGTVIGVYFLATLVNGSFILGAKDYVAPLITGAALILAVLGNRALARANV